MFSVVSVCDSVYRDGEERLHVTITHDALDLTIQGHPPTCSIFFIMNHVRLVSGQLASTGMLSCI